MCYGRSCQTFIGWSLSEACSLGLASLRNRGVAGLLNRWNNIRGVLLKLGYLNFCGIYNKPSALQLKKTEVLGLTSIELLCKSSHEPLLGPSHYVT